MTQGNAKARVIPVEAARFEDIIDGYFPLQESLRQMLCRNGFASACVTLTHVPIMDIPNLAPEAPVPLRLIQGVSGIADRLDIIVTLDGIELQLCGAGKWRWYSKEREPAKLLSPLTRLAEPAIVQGVGLIAGGTQTQTFGKIAIRQQSEFVILQGQGINLRGLPHALLWAKSPVIDGIHSDVDCGFAGLFETQAREIEHNLRQCQTSKRCPPKFTEILGLNDPTALSCVDGSVYARVDLS